MINACLTFLYRHWRLRSLSIKLVVPLVGLMIASLVGSTLTFMIGTARTYDQLLAQQTAADGERVRAGLNSRVDLTVTAATLLANDPAITQALAAETAASLPQLNSRAVVVRDRFELDLIQIYNQRGEARTNLVLSSLYRQSSLLYLVQPGQPAVYLLDDRLLLLARANLPGNAGAVITGIDLATELTRILNRDRLTADLGLKLEDFQVSTNGPLPFERPDGQYQNLYLRQIPLQLGQSSLQFLVSRQTTDVTYVTQAGLLVMVSSTLVTALLLIGLGIVVTNAITRPVHRLAAAAQDLARGDLSRQVELISLPHSFGIGNQDEIGLLTQAFDTMVVELRELYQDLESKVESRTKQLMAASDVARAASSSLNLEIILHTTVELICDRFGFYHASVFLIEPGSDVAVLHESTSQPGQILKERRHQLAVGSRSLVGVATATRRPRIVQDVLVDESHFKNPLLPATRAEAVFPLLSGETVVGALDVQSTQVNAFTPDLVDLLMTLADQIAVAVFNARLYEQQKGTAEHLAQVDRLKTEFLTIMSHELRTPLNSIIGFSKVILKGIDGPITDQQRNDLTSIYNNGQHLLGLINNILDFSKIEAGKLELNFEEVDLRQKIQTAVRSAAGLLQDKPVELEVQLPEGPLTVEADGTRFQQILLNLVSNAAKFTEAGKITITAGRHDDWLTVSVADTGIGIPDDKITEIFKEFTQVDSSNTRRFSGTGLGLPIAKRLVELHGGRIWAESQPGRGSTFTFKLPVREANRPISLPLVSQALVPESSLSGGIS